MRVKNCPFCGHIAECHDSESNYGFDYKVTCGQDRCYGNSSALNDSFNSRNLAIREWNKRVKPTRKRKSRDRRLLEALLNVLEIDDNRLDGEALTNRGRRIHVFGKTNEQLIAIKEAMQKGGAK